jgi:hypothetical protein
MGQRRSFPCLYSVGFRSPFAPSSVSQVASYFSGSVSHKANPKMILLNVANALLGLWSIRVKHNDLKMRNILVKGDQYVLTDFDSAEIVSKAEVDADPYVLFCWYGSSLDSCCSFLPMLSHWQFADVQALACLLNKSYGFAFYQPIGIRLVFCRLCSLPLFVLSLRLLLLFAGSFWYKLRRASRQQYMSLFNSSKLTKTKFARFRERYRPSYFFSVLLCLLILLRCDHEIE